MPMKVTTVRFGERRWTMLEQEARRGRVGVAQLVRETAAMPLGHLMRRRGELAPPQPCPEPVPPR